MGVIEDVEGTAFTMNTGKSVFERMMDYMAGGLEESEIDTLWYDYFVMDENDRELINGYFKELGQMYSLGIDNFKDIVDSEITDAGGNALGFSQKVQLSEILTDAGFSGDDISAFFTNMGTVTSEGIKNFLFSVSGKLPKEKFKNLTTEMFDFLTGGVTSQEFANKIEEAKTSTGAILDLQKKYLEEGLSAEEYATVMEKIQDPELLSKFFSGTLTGEDFIGGYAEGLKNEIAQALSAVENEIATTGLTNELALERMYLTDFLENLDDMIYDQSNTMIEYYQSQIEYIQKVNSEIQEQISLEQQRMDMNRSMLSLNRQIRALESDTSYGAQARLEDLRSTREQEALSRQAFIMDMVANQQISDLEDKVQNGILGNTAATAAGVQRLVELAAGSISDYKTIEQITGASVGGGGSAGSQALNFASAISQPS